jgi:serine/threonine protein kinase
MRSRLIKYSEVVEDWEIEFGSHRFSYKELYKATNGFKEKELLGVGGFGRVYKSALRRLRIEITVKRVLHDSKQGMKEFSSEIACLGRLQHRNIVLLLGLKENSFWCVPSCQMVALKSTYMIQQNPI